MKLYRVTKTRVNHFWGRPDARVKVDFRTRRGHVTQAILAAEEGNRQADQSGNPRAVRYEVKVEVVEISDISWTDITEEMTEAVRDWASLKKDK